MGCVWTGVGFFRFHAWLRFVYDWFRVGLVLVYVVWGSVYGGFIVHIRGSLRDPGPPGPPTFRGEF